MFFYHYHCSKNNQIYLLIKMEILSYLIGHVAEWLRRGLQILLSQFDSGRGLQKNQLFYIIKKSMFAFIPR